MKSLVTFGDGQESLVAKSKGGISKLNVLVYETDYL